MDPDVYLKGAAAVVALAFAAILLLASPQRAGRALAVFFALIAANQAAETVRWFAWHGQIAVGEALVHRVAYVPASLDPLALYAFAAFCPGWGAFATRRGWIAVGAGSLLFVALTPWVRPAEEGGLHAVVGWALSAFTAAVYLTVLWHLLRATAQGGRPRPELRLLVPALMLAAVPVAYRCLWGAAAALVARGLWPGGLAWAVAATVLPLVLLAAGLAAALRRLRLRGSVARIAWLGFAAGTAIAGLLSVFLLTISVFQAHPPYPLVFLSNGGASIRWLLFGFLVCAAVVKHDVLHLDLAKRRPAARVLLGLAVAVPAALAIAAGHVWGTWTDGVRAIDLVVVAVAVLASQWFRSTLDWMAGAVLGVPRLGSGRAAIAAFRAGVVQALEEGDTAAGRERLLRLQDELGLDEPTARLVEEMVRAAAAAPLAPGQLVAGRYRLERVLSRSGLGTAFLATDERLLREVVLKEVAEAGPAGPQTSRGPVGPMGTASSRSAAGAAGGRDGSGTPRALQEARLAGSLDHPNVVTVHDVLHSAGRWLLVMEYVPGGSLAQRLEAGPLEVAAAARLLDGVLAALEAVHAQGIVHCDLTTANVLLAKDGTAKLADFGIARLQSGTLDAARPQAPVGTPGFMAPEQRAGRAVGPAADVYAVGVLVGRLLPKGPPAALRLARRACHEDPRRRPGVAALRAGLAKALRSVPRGTAAASAPPRPGRRSAAGRPRPPPGAES